MGTPSTREGLGALVVLETSAGRQVREARTSGSHASAQDPRVHFGLGSAKVEAIEVRWPSGARDRVKPTPDALLVGVKEGGGSLPTTVPGDHD